MPISFPRETSWYFVVVVTWLHQHEAAVRKKTGDSNRQSRQQQVSFTRDHRIVSHYCRLKKSTKFMHDDSLGIKRQS